MSSLKRSLTLFFIAGFFFLLQGQENLQGIPLLDSLIASESYTEAQSNLQKQLDLLFLENAMDSLVYYPYYVGKIAYELSDSKTAIESTESFLKKLKSNSITNRVLYNAYLNITGFYDEIGETNNALNITKRSNVIISQVPDATAEEVGKTEYNIGVYYLSLGQIAKSKVYFHKALSTYNSSDLTSKLSLSDAYNALGATMWMSSKLDSAKTFYNKAVQKVLEHNGDSISNLFQAASIRANISLVEHSSGDLNQALVVQKQVLEDYHKVLRFASNTELLEKTKRNELIAIYNLSSFYTEIGNLKKARDILEYAYEKAKNILAKNDPELPRYLIALGQSEISLHNYSKAIDLAKQGLNGLEKIKVDDPYWKGHAAFIMAEANNSLDNIAQANHFYNISEGFFIRALGNSYDSKFLNLYREKALFLAHQNKKEDAINTAKKAYEYLQKTTDNGNLAYVKSLENLSEVNYISGDYSSSLQWAEKGLAFLKNQKSDSTQELSILQIDFRRVPLLLLKLKSMYELTEIRDISFIENQINALSEATQILENRKVFTSDLKDINLINHEYKGVNEFAKKLSLERYQKTGEEKNLNHLISLHESGVYHRIRTNLNIKENTSFYNVNERTSNQEKLLKSRISSSLSKPENSVVNFFDATKKWNSFLDSLKVAYPKYYIMRYATIEETLGDIKQKIPSKTTVVRYLFIEDKLYCYIANTAEEHFIQLDFDYQKNTISQLSDYSNDLDNISKISNELYNQLWRPIANYISTKKVIIFPDRQLFNLNFDLLSSKKLQSFNDFAEKSLLAQYSISYNYSLLLLDSNRKPFAYQNDVVAFAPEFNKTMKDEYQLAISDSLELDKTYLTLLPQPFVSDVVKKFSKKFSGSSFLNEKASKQLFTVSAKEHKIIHIGTHAESNNVSPELSRLVFAKNVSDSTTINDNYLYTYEIYNQDLSSNLAILTACETGKPTYQPGEGMISLAHAFNYAGSESILTSLWQIDEQSSTQILDYFYTYLEQGLPKDEALKNAKLDYLANAKGRTLHPQYWAGLVLMGDTAPIDLSASTNWLWWILVIITLIVVTFLLYRKRKSPH